MSYNNITIIGRLGRDAEVRMTPQGKEVVSASVAAGSKDKAVWFKVTAWEKTGMFFKEARKGDQVFVDGTLEVREYKGKTGETKVELIVNAKNIRTFTKSEPQAAMIPVDLENDLPF